MPHGPIGACPMFHMVSIVQMGSSDVIRGLSETMDWQVGQREPKKAKSPLVRESVKFMFIELLTQLKYWAVPINIFDSTKPVLFVNIPSLIS